MTRRWSLIFGLLLVLAILGACGGQLTVEQQVIVTIREMEARIEAGERRPFMEYIAEDFTAQSGALNRDQLNSYVLLQLNRHKRLKAQLFPITVQETGEGTATASFHALVTGGPGWLPESGQVFDFDTSWRFEDDEWRLVTASWDPVPIEDVL